MENERESEVDFGIGTKIGAPLAGETRMIRVVGGRGGPAEGEIAKE